MKKYSFVALFAALCFLLSMSSSTPVASRPHPQEAQAENAVVRNMIMLGPAAAGMDAAGFHASGTVTVIPQEEEVGTDMIKIKVHGLPPNTDFTVFLHELSDIPFGSSQYIALLHTNKNGKGVVVANTVIMEAFALKTAGDPPRTRLIDVDLKFVALWFADSKDAAKFTDVGSLAFDGDRESGAVVLGTTLALH